MKFNIVLSFTLSVICSVLHQTPVTNAIMGLNTRKVVEGEFPFIVSLMNIDFDNLNPLENHVCTASLISRRHVLSAKHCTEDREIIDTAVIVGSPNLFNGIVHEIKWWISYEEWAQYRGINVQFRSNDITIIKLIQKVDSSISVGVISELTNADLYGKEAVVAGWGKGNDNETPRTLRSASLRFMTIEECEIRISELNGDRLSIHPRFLCTSTYPFVLLQFGDSGGPVMYMGKIVGINKSTIPLPDQPIHPRKVNLHVGIDYYRDFITDVKKSTFRWR